MKQFLVVTPGGSVVQATSDPHEALATAQSMGPSQWLAPTELDAPRASNPPLGPEQALKKAKLSPISWDEVASIAFDKQGLARAHATLAGIFDQSNRAAKRVAAKSRGKKVEEITGLGMSLTQWLSPGSGFLTANAKLMKRDDGREGVALGLNLVPEYTVGRLESAAGVRLPFVTAPVIGGGTAVNFCTGSSQECRTSCLVNTGQNASDIRNTYTKFAKAKALLEHPVEFMAILAAGLRKYEEAEGDTLSGKTGKAEKFVRLNVLSDIPWELFAPWLFDAFPGLTFYDYTKVPGRYHPKYDLTFSYSGENMPTVEREFAAGKRIAAVFLAPEYIKGQVAARVAKAQSSTAIRAALESADKAAKGEASYKTSKVGLAAWRAVNPIPRTFRIGQQEVPVVDGDYTDFRPWDPAGVVVALRWKTPRILDKKTGKRRELRLDETPRSFVIMGEVREGPDGPYYVLAHTPNSDDNTDDVARAADASLRETLYDAERAKELRRKRLPTIERAARAEWVSRFPEPGEAP
ncbi:MAG: hypothetical protein IT371_30585 [Deltaproteobacteria bacterium]|nr:hypothetical protein [Deltaproteobacteria bacterium]